MGASGSSSPATVVTVLDQPHATAGGGPVSGKVYLDVRKPVEAGSLQVVISGYERTCVHYTTTHSSGTGKNRKTRTQHHYARARSDFMNVNFALAHFGSEKVPVGQYVYPFTFHIPCGVPPPAEKAGASNFSIGYCVETCLSRNGGLFSGDIKHSCPFNVISGAARIPISPLYMEPERRNVRTCFCFDRGEILLGGSGDTSIVPLGGHIRLSYAMRNLSSVKINNISIKIVERARWSARGHTAFSSEVLFGSEMNASEKNNQTQMDSTDLLPLDKKLQKSTMLEIDSLLRDLKLKLDAGTATVNAVVPNNARCSYNGNGLIRIDHLLVLKVNTSAGTANPETTYPIILCNPPTEQLQMPVLQATLVSAVPALPADWAPVVAQAVVVPPPMCMATPQEQDEEHYNSLAIPSAPPAPASLLQQGGVVSVQAMGWESLLAALPGNFEPCKLLDQWLEMNAAQLSSFEPHYFTRLFQNLHRSFDQSEAAEILAERYMTHITCAAIAAAANGCFRENRVSVITQLASKNTVVDKDNYGVIMEQLSSFQWLQVEMYFIESNI